MSSKLILSSKIGAGGFSIVYDGLYNGIRVAIKKIANFETVPYLMELSIMSGFKKQELNFSINIISNGESAYIIQQLAITDLRRYLKTNFISIRNKKFGIRSVVKGIRYLHLNNIVHCDIKPSNILVYSNNNIIQWKLADFGISKFIGSKSKISCTSLYRPREAWDDTIVDVTMDYWSLGCTIYQIIYEKLLFQNQKTIYINLKPRGTNLKPRISIINTNKNHLKERYLLAINEFNNKFYNTPIIKSKVDYNSPNIEMIEEDNNLGLLDLLNPDPEKRSIKQLLLHLNIKTQIKENIVPITPFNKTIKRYKEKTKTKISPNTIKIIQWMIDKLYDPFAPTPKDIPLYKALLIERDIFQTLDYCIL